MSRRIIRKYESVPEANQIKYTHPHPDDLILDAQPDVDNGKVVQQTMLREASFGSLLSDVSDNTDRSTSSLSWEEEIDSENSEKVKQVLDAIDEFLYEGKYPINVNEEIIDDCKTWAAQIPHLRIIGQNLELNYDDIFSINQRENDNGEIPDSHEEIILEHSSVCSRPKSNSPEPVQNECDISELKEKVLDEIVQLLLPKVIDWQNLIRTYQTIVRPYSAIPRIKRSLRPMTAEDNHLFLPPVSPLSQPLQGILTISSKILQDRKIKSTGSIVPRFRPASSTLGFHENRRNSIYSNSKQKFSRITIPKLTAMVPDSKYILQDNINNKSILPDISSPTDISQSFGLLELNSKSLRYRQINTATSRPGTGRFKNIQEEATIPILNTNSPRSSALVRRSHSRLRNQQ